MKTKTETQWGVHYPDDGYTERAIPPEPFYASADNPKTSKQQAESDVKYARKMEKTSSPATAATYAGAYLVKRKKTVVSGKGFKFVSKSKWKKAK